MIWFGRLSAISQLASRVGGGGGDLGNILSISLHYMAQGERQGGGRIPSPWIESRTVAIVISQPQWYNVFTCKRNVVLQDYLFYWRLIWCHPPPPPPTLTCQQSSLLHPTYNESLITHQYASINWYFFNPVPYTVTKTPQKLLTGRLTNFTSPTCWDGFKVY